MSKFAIMILCGLMFVTVGCKKDHMDDDDMNGSMSGSSSSTSSMKSGGADACTHCPGHQTATADGKCPGCGAKAKM